MGLFSKDIGIDLGTANTLVAVKGEGIIISEPSVVAIDTTNNTILAVGQAAKDMIGKTPSNIQAIRPLREGVIADFNVTQKMLEYFIKKAVNKSAFIFKPRVVVGVPSDVTEVEKRAVLEAALSAGAKKALLLEEPMAAAIGAGLDVALPSGNMVVDIGGGTSEIAVISLGGIVTSRSIRIAGDDFDKAIEYYIRKKYSLSIGSRTSENIKTIIGSAFDIEDKKIDITGRNLVNGLPKTLTVNSSEIREAIAIPVKSIIDGIKLTLESTPPELASDIMLKGIMLAGGGALLKGLDVLIAKETGMPVFISEDPLDCVVKGTEKALEHYDLLQSVFVSTKTLRK
ncbi:rod shape-determining protein [Clostridiaceae bacterium HSG29]|nr:rod shape-determining protein [Clostridiaceae bacterium HSG29]